MNDRIKQVRKNNNLTQTEFGERIGATRAMIASYEGGAVIPADSILKLISKVFGVSYAWLKTGEGPMEDLRMDASALARITAAYSSLPDRLRSLVDALAEMDPEWYKTLDAALEIVEKRKKEGAD